MTTGSKAWVWCGCALLIAWALYACFLLVSCGGATVLDAQNANDAVRELHCEDVGHAAPDGGHMHAYHDCLKDAGLTE